MSDVVAEEDYRTGISWDLDGAGLRPDRTVLDPAGIFIAADAIHGELHARLAVERHTG